MAVRDSCVITTSFSCVSLKHSSTSLSSIGERLRLPNRPTPSYPLGPITLASSHFVQGAWFFFFYHLSELSFMWVNVHVNAVRNYLKSGEDVCNQESCVNSLTTWKYSVHVAVFWSENLPRGRLRTWTCWIGWPSECNEYAESLGRKDIFSSGYFLQCVRFYLVVHW